MSSTSQSRFVNRIMFCSHPPCLRLLFASPPKSIGVKVREITPAGSKVPKIVLEFSNLPEEESERLKKLLNSIDKVEEQVLQQLQILENTASAKEAERENRVRTLMSMRWSYIWRIPSSQADSPTQGSMAHWHRSFTNGSPTFKGQLSQSANYLSSLSFMTLLILWVAQVTLYLIIQDLL